MSKKYTFILMARKVNYGLIKLLYNYCSQLHGATFMCFKKTHVLIGRFYSF
jgi:hypothetical protein